MALVTAAGPAPPGMGPGVARPAQTGVCAMRLLMQWFGGIVFAEIEEPAEWGPVHVPNG